MKSLLHFLIVAPAMGLFYLIAFPVYVLVQISKLVLQTRKPAHR